MNLLDLNNCSLFTDVFINVFCCSFSLLSLVCLLSQIPVQVCLLYLFMYLSIQLYKTVGFLSP